MDMQIWLITGAGRGLGRALVEAVLDAGHTVVATVRDPAALPARDRLLALQLDVRDRSACRAAVDRAVDVHGRLDVLVNNAGYGLVGAIEEADEPAVRGILDTDLLGPLWLSQAAAAVMRPRRSGHIVQISTVGAVGAMPTLGLYNAAKWGLEGFSEALASEMGPFGVRVSIVEPGGLDTGWSTSGMQFAAPDPGYDDLRTRLFGTPEVPWPSTVGTAGGTTAQDAAAAVLRHVADPADGRLRLLVGDDAPGQVAEALRLRIADYRQDGRFAATWEAPAG